MVQVTFDTKTDSLEELQHALALLQQGIAQRAAKTAPKLDMAAVEPIEETALDTGFLKITVTEAHEEAPQEAPAVPTLNQLLDESLNEEELGKLFKEQQKYEEEHPQKHKEKHSEDAYIEIIEYADEEKK